MSRPVQIPFGPGVTRLQARFDAWMFDDALPAWTELGLDSPGLGFREELNLDATPSDVAFKRMRVQARQIYVFSHAHLLGYPGGAEIAGAGIRFILAHGRRADGAWVRMLGRDGTVLDPTADLYDIAFVLLALAWYHRATQDAEPLRLARRTLEWVRATMAAPVGGYHNSFPVAPGHRQQNPHMHLLEAALALYDASQDGYFADLAHELVGLFRSHFHHGESGTLGEFYDEMLVPAAAEAGTQVEPGHQYEWVWLLDQYTRLLGGTMETEMAQLYAFAERFGRGPDGLVALDELGRDGSVRRDTARLWPQTEALKAQAAMARRGRAIEQRLESDLTVLLDRYLGGCPRGMWRDQFTAAGEAIAKKIPASSLYHIFVAFAELRDTIGTSPLTG